MHTVRHGKQNPAQDFPDGKITLAFAWIFLVTINRKRAQTGGRTLPVRDCDEPAEIRNRGKKTVCAFV